MLQLIAIFFTLLVRIEPFVIFAVLAKGAWETFGRLRAKQRAKKILATNVESSLGILRDLDSKSTSDLDVTRQAIIDKLRALSDRDLKWVELGVNQKSQEAGRRYIEDLVVSNQGHN